MPDGLAPLFSPSMSTVRKKILFICGSLNQTTQMHQISQALPEYDHYFTPYYCDGLLNALRKRGMLEFTILGGAFLRRTVDYLRNHTLTVDYRGEAHEYDLVVRCSDLIVPKNTRYKRSILVQEGMTDPKNVRFYLIRYLRLFPRWMASTATIGLSHRYDRFCIASEGYRDHFIRNGLDASKLVVTGIPNFDHCDRYRENAFPYHGYALVCTSDMRETYRYENRRQFIKRAARIADGRQLIFKLHPNEDFERATREIERYAPGALVFTSGSAEEMVANCDIFITRYSSTVFVAAALGKTIYSDLDGGELARLAPVQNRSGARNIANVCRELIDQTAIEPARSCRPIRQWAKELSFLPSNRREKTAVGV